MRRCPLQSPSRLGRISCRSFGTRLEPAFSTGCRDSLRCSREGEAHTAKHICNIWNARYAGTLAFETVVNGYKVGSIFGQRYQAHRIIWKMETGDDPDEVDHEDGNKLNNRWGNLRDVTSLGNRKNAAIGTRNKSGALGVYWHKPTARWRAFGVIAGKQIALGYFHDFDEAASARKAWERENGFHKNHGRAAA